MSTTIEEEGTTMAAAETLNTPSTVANAFVQTVQSIISSTTSKATTTSTAALASTTTTSTAAPATGTTTLSTPSSSSMTEKLSVSDLSSALQHFGIVDYLVFIAMLVVCAVIGFYFGFIEKKKKKQKGQVPADEKDGPGAAGSEERRGSEALDYLVGGRKMKVFPVSLSLVASFVSGISLLGTSTEIYVYGTQYAFILITLAISGLISWYIFLPVFCNLQLTSTYEYFERRFDRRIRIFGSCLFVLMNILWQPICIYVPALTLNQVSGISVHTIVPLTSLICIIYTSIGGIKGVVWTDVIQGAVMVGAMGFVIIKGTYDLGGLAVVLERNRQFDRLVGPDMTFDPTARMGVFALFVGGAFFKLQANCINQTAVQRFLTLPNFKAVKQALLLSLTGFILVMAMCIYIGMLAFAAYYHCDPITTGLARAKDQVIPLYVMQSAGVVPGIVGLFVAAVVLKDFVEPYRSRPLTERQTAYVLRGVVVVFGLISMASVSVVQKLGMLMQLSSTVGAVTCGPLLGAFSVGMLLPFVRTESLLTGISVATTFTCYIVVRAQIAIATGQMNFHMKPVSVEDCDYSFEVNANWNTPSSANTYEDKGHSLHEISFLWYTLIGSLGTVLCSLLATLYFGKQDVRLVDKELISPVLHKYWYGEYKSVVSDDEGKKHLKLHESLTQPKLDEMEQILNRYQAS